jgi:hypothetical protein
VIKQDNERLQPDIQTFKGQELYTVGIDAEIKKSINRRGFHRKSGEPEQPLS